MENVSKKQEMQLRCSW